MNLDLFGAAGKIPFVHVVAHHGSRVEASIGTKFIFQLSNDAVAVEARDDEWGVGFEVLGDVTVDTEVVFDWIFALFDQTQRAFAEADCRIVHFVEGKISGVGVYPFDFEVSSVGFGDFEHFFAEVEAGHLVATLGEFDAVASGSTTDIENCSTRFERVEREEEVDFGNGVLGERILFVGCRLAVEEVSPHGSHCVKGTSEELPASSFKLQAIVTHIVKRFCGEDSWELRSSTSPNHAKLEMWTFAER